ARGEMHQVARQDPGSRARGEVKGQVFDDVVALPEGKGAAVRRVLEFADAGVGNSDGLGQMAGEGTEELLADAGRGPFNHGTESVQVVGHRGGGRGLACTVRRAARFLNL